MQGLGAPVQEQLKRSQRPWVESRRKSTSRAEPDPFSIAPPLLLAIRSAWTTLHEALSGRCKRGPDMSRRAKSDAQAVPCVFRKRSEISHTCEKPEASIAPDIHYKNRASPIPRAVSR